MLWFVYDHTHHHIFIISSAPDRIPKTVIKKITYHALIDFFFLPPLLLCQHIIYIFEGRIFNDRSRPEGTSAEELFGVMAASFKKPWEEARIIHSIFFIILPKKKPLVRADAHTHLKVAPASMKWHSSKQSVPDDDAASGHPPPLIHYHHLFLFVITYSPFFFFYFKAH